MHLLPISASGIIFRRPDINRATISTRRDHISRGTLHIRSEDAVSLPFLEDGSVDRVLGMNVIYFLNPLDKYLR